MQHVQLPKKSKQRPFSTIHLPITADTGLRDPRLVQELPLPVSTLADGSPSPILWPLDHLCRSLVGAERMRRTREFFKRGTGAQTLGLGTHGSPGAPGAAWFLSLRKQPLSSCLGTCLDRECIHLGVFGGKRKGRGGSSYNGLVSSIGLVPRIELQFDIGDSGARCD